MLSLCATMLLAGTALSASAPDGDPPPPAAAQKSPPPSADQDADDDDEGKAQPNTPVVITAKRLDAARTQIDAGLGSTVYSLNNDTIDDRPNGESGSIADILLQSPGVTFSGDAVTIRGSKDIQIRVNNVIIPEAISDPADHFSARLAETTRVLTGTLPAQFGFVPAGVISFTTKNGLYHHGGEVEYYAGTDGFMEPAVEWEGSALNTSLFGSASLEADRTDVADLDGNRTRDRRREIGGLAFGDHILDPDDRISFIVGADDERHTFGATSLPAGSDETADGFVVGTFQHSAGEFTVQASLFGAGATDDAIFADRTRERHSSFGTQVDASYSLADTHVLKAGLLASHSTVDELEGGGATFSGSRDPVALYVQDEWKLSSTLTFNPGVRADWLRGFGHRGTIEPRASLVWTLPKGLTAHLGYARYATAAPLGEDLGTTPLPSERDDYFDAGIQYRLGAMTLGADAYRRNARNYLDEYQAIGSALRQSFAFRQARFRGVELSATYSTHPLSAWLNLSFSRGRGLSLIDPAGIFAPATLAAAASHWIPLASDRPVTASTGLTWRAGKIALSGTVDASGGAVRSLSPADPNGARASAFATLGFSAVYHAGTAQSRRDFRVDVTNLANAHYLLNDAASLEGGWTRWGRGRAITFGFEQGF
jgi:hypothetical protein